MILTYLLKTVVISGCLFLYYTLFLRNRAFHRFNRVFLLLLPVIGFGMPLLQLEWPTYFLATPGDNSIRMLGVVQGEMEATVTVYANKPFAAWLSWQCGLALASGAVSLFLLARLTGYLFQLRRLTMRSLVVPIDGAWLCLVHAKGTPFSFFRRIFWNPALDVEGAEGRQMLSHELYHVKAGHSRDILWLESIAVIFWFNPFLYLVRKEILMLHEFMADASVAAQTDRIAYAELLVLHQTSLTAGAGITHSFFHHPLKRRITMLTTGSNKKTGLKGRLLLLPVIAGLTGIFAFRTDWKTLTAPPPHAMKRMKIAIDPGHGGVFTGASDNGVVEKEFNLLMAKKIREVAKTFDVDVVLTREGDNTPEREQTLRSSLEYRAKFAEDNHADVFVSVHMNSSGEEKISGFEIFVPKPVNAQYENSRKLGSSISGYLSKDYQTAIDLKERDMGVMILDRAKVPSILIECGNLNVKKDVDFMMDPANQEKIARDILEGILKYGQAEISPGKTGDTGNDKPKQVAVLSAAGRPAMAGDSLPVLKKVEVESEYPGGYAGWVKYLRATLKYPDTAVNKEIQGTVVVEFVINKDGSIDTKTVRAISGPELLKAESIRVVSESGRWIPARDHGLPVNAYKRQPINYKLEVQ